MKVHIPGHTAGKSGGEQGLLEKPCMSGLSFQSFLLYPKHYKGQSSLVFQASNLVQMTKKLEVITGKSSHDLAGKFKL